MNTAVIPVWVTPWFIKDSMDISMPGLHRDHSDNSMNTGGLVTPWIIKDNSMNTAA